MMLESFQELLTAYLEEHLKGKASYRKQVLVASQWLRKLTIAPTRAQVLERRKLKGHGHYEKGCAQANTEFALLRAACRWGIYEGRWGGGDPTVGIKKWKTKRRKRVSKFEEITRLLRYFDGALIQVEIRDRALYGLMQFTGCRPGEARTAKLDAITPYGQMGCWNKGKTKNGEEYEVPVPKQYMSWLAAWKAIRPASSNPHLFPGQEHKEPLNADSLVRRWRDLRLMLGIQGLWTYDLRRSLATHLSNELKYADAVIDAILGHEKTTSLGYYLHVSFDAMTKPIQHYADWLCGLRQDLAVENREPVFVSTRQAVPVPAAPPPSLIAPPLVDEEEERRLHLLSVREREVLAWFAHGQTCTYIGARLGISPKTVYTHRANLMEKLHLTKVTDLIRYAIEHQADRPVAIPTPPTTSPVTAQAVVSQTIPAPAPIAYRSHSVEREEWPG